MNIRNVILAILVPAFSILAQDSNEIGTVSLSPENDPMGQQTNQAKSYRGKKNDPDQKKQSEKRRAKFKHRRIQLMERELNRIGITEEEKAKIIELQKVYKEKMQANAQRIAAAREKLSELQDEGAPMEILETAIQDISAAQAEQLRTLVRNRMEMERILGKEKLALFMQNARTQYQKHGHRGAPPLPPRPGLPPVPGQESKLDGKPPTPHQTAPAPENAPPGSP